MMAEGIGLLGFISRRGGWGGGGTVPVVGVRLWRDVTGHTVLDCALL